MPFAAEFNRPEIVELLIKSGAKVDAKDHRGASPLYLAAGFNPDTNVIDVLAKHGANPRVKVFENPDGTALHMAAMFNSNPRTIAKLVSLGPAVSERNNRQETPLHAAARFNSNPGVIRALINEGADAYAKEFPWFHALSPRCGLCR
ncbi:ankyrin repeat domain-containing protein [Oceanithermus sp.]